MILPLLCWMMGLWVFPGKVSGDATLIDGVYGTATSKGLASGNDKPVDNVLAADVTRVGSISTTATLLGSVK